MKNKSNKTNARYTENKGVNEINAVNKEIKSGCALKKTDINFGGWFFTSCICAYMLLQLVYAVAVTVVAQKTGSSVETTSGKPAFKFLAYCVCGTAIFACALFYSLKEKTNLLSYVKVKKFSIKYALIAVVCLFGLLLGLGKANDLFIYFLNKLSYNPPQVTLPPASVGNYLLGLLCICLLPAVSRGRDVRIDCEKKRFGHSHDDYALFKQCIGAYIGLFFPASRFIFGYKRHCFNGSRAYCACNFVRVAF